MTDSRGLGCADERRREVTLDELDELIKFVLMVWLIASNSEMRLSGLTVVQQNDAANNSDDGAENVSRHSLHENE